MPKHDTRTRSAVLPYKAPQRRGMSAMLRRLAARRTAHALSALAFGVALVPHAQAAPALYWDTNGATGGVGGTGIWDVNTTTDWTTDSTGATATATYSALGGNTDPGNATIAHFGGTAGIVTIAANTTINVNSLVFDAGTGNYTIAGTDGTSVLNLSGTGPTITNNVASGSIQTISAKITGTSGFTLTGPNFTVLTGDLSGLSGTVNVNGRLNLQGTTLTGSQFQTWNIASGQNLTSNNTGTGSTIQLGALTGSGTLRAGNSNVGTAGGTDIFQIGALNLNTEFSGAIQDFSPAKAGITKVGTGTLILSGTSSYTGATTISGGTLQIGNGGTTGTLGSTSNIVDNGSLVFNRSDTFQTAGNNPVISGTGTITLNGTGTVILTGANTNTGTTFINSGTLQVSANGSSAQLGSGNIVNNGTLAFSRTNAITVGNTISGTGGVSQISTGNLILTGANIYTGATKVNSGTLTLGGGGTLGSSGNYAGAVTIASGAVFNDNSTAAQTLSGLVSGAGALTVSGPGTLTLTGANTYTGGTTVSGGTLMVDYNAAGAATGNIIDPGKALTVSGGTFNVNGNATNNRTQTFASLSVGTGASTVSVTNNGAAATDLTFTSGTVTRATGGLVNFVSPAGTGITLGATANPFIGAWAFLNGTSYAATDVTGRVIAAASTGVTGVNSFTSATANYAYTSPSPGSPDTETVPAATANTATFAGATPKVIDLGASGANTLTLNGFVNNGGALTIQRSGGTGTLNIGSANELIIGGAGNVTISAPVVNNGATASALTLSNTGTVTLSGANTYTGGTTLNAGTLAVGNDSALGTGAVTIKDGATLANNDSAAHTLSNAMTLNGPAQGITFAGSQDLALTGVFSSAAAVKVTKTGSSVLTLSADNTAGGALTASGNAWTVTGGAYNSDTGLYSSVLAVNSGRALGSGTGNLLTLDAGTLQFTADGGTGYANSRTINVTANGGAINDGGFAFGEATSGGGTFNPFINLTGVAPGAGLNLVSSNKLQYSGVISGSGSVNTFGTGTVTLIGNSTYSGGTTVNSGTLALAGAANSNNITGTGSVTVKGAGTTSAASTTQGVLQLNASNQIANAAAITLAGGTFNANGNSEGAAGATPTTGLGALTMTTSAGNFSFLDFGPTTSGSNTLAFADSSATNGGTFGTNQTLQVLGYQYGDAGVFDHLYFGTVTGGGLTPTQLSQISFVNINGVAGNNLGAMMLANGEIAPTPEPGSVIPIIIGMAGLGVLIARKRKANAKNSQNELAAAV